MKMYLVTFDGYYGGYGSRFCILGVYDSTTEADEAVCVAVEEMHMDPKMFKIIELEANKTYSIFRRPMFEEFITEKEIGGYIE